MSCGVAAMPLRKPAGKRRSTDSGVEPDRGALSQEKKDQRIALFLSDFDQQGRAGGGGEALGAAPRPGRAPAPAGGGAAPGALGLPSRTPGYRASGHPGGTGGARPPALPCPAWEEQRLPASRASGARRAASRR